MYTDATDTRTLVIIVRLYMYTDATDTRTLEGLPRVRYKWNSLTSRSVSLTCPKQQLNTCSFYGPFNIVPTEVQQWQWRAQELLVRTDIRLCESGHYSVSTCEYMVCIGVRHGTISQYLRIPVLNLYSHCHWALLFYMPHLICH